MTTCLRSREQKLPVNERGLLKIRAQMIMAYGAILPGDDIASSGLFLFNFLTAKKTFLVRDVCLVFIFSKKEEEEGSLEAMNSLLHK